LPIDVIQRARPGLIAERGADRLAKNDTLKSHHPHQVCNGAAGDIEAFPPQLPPDLTNAINPKVLIEHAIDLRLQNGIPLRPEELLLRIGPFGDVIVIRRWGDPQNPADRLDPMRIALIVDDCDHRLNGRSNSAWAK
jgi:hypothetical protein